MQNLETRTLEIEGDAIRAVGVKKGLARSLYKVLVVEFSAYQTSYTRERLGRPVGRTQNETGSPGFCAGAGVLATAFQLAACCEAERGETKVVENIKGLPDAIRDRVTAEVSIKAVARLHVW